MGMHDHLINGKLANTLKTERGQWLLFLGDDHVIRATGNKILCYAISLQNGEKKALLIAKNNKEGLNELLIRLQLADSEYVMPLEDYFITTEGTVYTISPYAPGGTLEERFATASPSQIVEWIREAKKGLIDFHRRNVEGGDAGFQNILLYKEKIRRVEFEESSLFIEPELGYAQFLSGDGLDFLALGQGLYADAKTRWGKKIPALIDQEINTIIKQADRVEEPELRRLFDEIVFNKSESYLSGRYAVSTDGETLAVFMSSAVTQQLMSDIQAIAAKSRVRNIVLQLTSADGLAAISSERYIPLGRKASLLPLEGQKDESLYPIFQLLLDVKEKSGRTIDYSGLEISYPLKREEVHVQEALAIRYLQEKGGRLETIPSFYPLQRRAPFDPLTSIDGKVSIGTQRMSPLISYSEEKGEILFILDEIERGLLGQRSGDDWSDMVQNVIAQMLYYARKRRATSVGMIYPAELIPLTSRLMQAKIAITACENIKYPAGSTPHQLLMVDLSDDSWMDSLQSRIGNLLKLLLIGGVLSGAQAPKESEEQKRIMHFPDQATILNYLENVHPITKDDAYLKEKELYQAVAEFFADQNKVHDGIEMGLVLVLYDWSQENNFSDDVLWLIRRNLMQALEDLANGVHL